MRRLAFLTLLAPLGACASMTLDDFAGGKPPMDLVDYFSGHSTAYGIFYGRSGDVKRQFVVQMQGAWDGNILKLDEDFSYSDGEKQQRHWSFRHDVDGGWIGTAPDVIGEARGRTVGNAYEMHYTADVKSGDSTYRLNFDDWLFRQSDDVVLNHAMVTKFGIFVGEVQLAFVKH
jgi:hypothetical protein